MRYAITVNGKRARGSYDNRSAAEKAAYRIKRHNGTILKVVVDMSKDDDATKTE